MNLADAMLFDAPPRSKGSKGLEACFKFCLDYQPNGKCYIVPERTDVEWKAYSKQSFLDQNRPLEGLKW